MKLNKRSDFPLSLRYRSVIDPLSVRFRFVYGTSGFFDGIFPSRSGHEFEGDLRYLAGSVVSGRGYIIGVCLVPAYEIGRRLQIPYFTGHLFSVLGHFGSIFAAFGQFRPVFRSDFPFFLFFRLRDMVYSRGRCDHVLLPIRTTVCGITSVHECCTKNDPKMTPKMTPKMSPKLPSKVI
jgi:hypothetical protein